MARGIREIDVGEHDVSPRRDFGGFLSSEMGFGNVDAIEESFGGY